MPDLELGTKGKAKTTCPGITARELLIYAAGDIFLKSIVIIYYFYLISRKKN
jgi:hypothetical protein